MMRFGPADGPVVVVVAPPLFEEANRTRALVAAVLRGLAERGIAGALPDLPGQGDSLVPTVEARLEHWREAFAAACRQAGPRPRVVALRGGALVDGGIPARRLHIAPATGASLVRDLMRARHAAALAVGGAPAADDPAEPGPPILLAGNLLDRSLLTELMAAAPTAADRVLTLSPEARDGASALAPPEKGGVEGRPRFVSPWRASEPMPDLRVAARIVGQVVDWVRACAT